MSLVRRAPADKQQVDMAVVEVLQHLRIWLDTAGDPITDAAKVTERMRRPDYGHLELEVTVNDPKAYTKPWTIQLKQIIQLDTDLLDYVCLENEKDLSHFVVK